jgi:hypothetical protein
MYCLMNVTYERFFFNKIFAFCDRDLHVLFSTDRHVLTNVMSYYMNGDAVEAL